MIAVIRRAETGDGGVVLTKSTESFASERALQEMSVRQNSAWMSLVAVC